MQICPLGQGEYLVLCIYYFNLILRILLSDGQNYSFYSWWNWGMGKLGNFELSVKDLVSFLKES